jgi:hypothetical protein
MKIIAYLKARVGERSTWVGVGLAASAAAVLPYPWNLVSFITGVIASLIPDGTVGA